MACAMCVNQLSHCHGTLVYDPSGERSCTDPRCTELDPARHELMAFP